MTNEEATTIATAIVEEIVSRFGMPYVLYLVQGAQFESKRFAEICRLLCIRNVRKSHTIPSVTAWLKASIGHGKQCKASLSANTRRTEVSFCRALLSHIDLLNWYFCTKLRIWELFDRTPWINFGKDRAAYTLHINYLYTLSLGSSFGKYTKLTDFLDISLTS